MVIPWAWLNNMDGTIAAVVSAAMVPSTRLIASSLLAGGIRDP
jgi:hypothetical protein